MTTPAYVITLERWRSDGTFAILERLQEEGTAVACPRSAGGTSPGKITSIVHAGLSVSIALDGGGHKLIGTETLIAHNPNLFPSKAP